MAQEDNRDKTESMYTFIQNALDNIYLPNVVIHYLFTYIIPALSMVFLSDFPFTLTPHQITTYWKVIVIENHLCYQYTYMVQQTYFKDLTNSW